MANGYWWVWGGGKKHSSFLRGAFGKNPSTMIENTCGMKLVLKTIKNLTCSCCLLAILNFYKGLTIEPGPTFQPISVRRGSSATAATPSDMTYVGSRSAIYRTNCSRDHLHTTSAGLSEFWTPPSLLPCLTDN